MGVVILVAILGGIRGGMEAGIIGEAVVGIAEVIGEIGGEGNI